MDNLNQIAVFLKVVETGSFSAAALQLGLTASAASKNVGQLENALGVRLLVRTTRSLTLTDAGATFFHRCRAAVGELRSATDEAQSFDRQLRGPLRVQATPGVGQRLLAPIVMSFMNEHPEITISLDIGTVNTSTVSTEMDVFVTVTHRGEMRGARFRAVELAEVRYLVCAAPEYIERRGRPQAPPELLRHNCLVHETQRAPREWRFAQPDGSTGAVKIKGTFSTNNALALECALLAGVGVGRIADYAARKYIEAGHLVVLFDNLVAWGQVVTAFFPSGLQSARAQAFIEYTKARMGGGFSSPAL
ncbi:MAG: LysR family transcriptional regulator [Beijerinckiaceae bacterium]|nr:LysR family transcriptional regulator [Beijerinckiaceae bacterium]